MRTAKKYREVTWINVRTEVECCSHCQCRLRRTCILAQRTIVTCTGVLYVTHSGYRCPDESCPERAIMHRSAQADALALPGFTCVLDVLL